MPDRRGFTLVELLVVITILTLLIAILLPSTARTRELARRVVCASNQRQIVLAAIVYSMGHPRGVYLPTTGEGEDDLNYLWPQYLPNSNIAICPSTANVVRPNVFIKNSTAQYGHPGLTDLYNNADKGAADSSGGHSYETGAWFSGPAIFPDGTTINGYTAGSIAYQRGGGTVTTTGGMLLKNRHNVSHPARAMFTMDGDDTGENNWPDATNNHGADGTNISFLDLHMQWCPPDYDLARAFVESYIGVSSTVATIGHIKITSVTLSGHKGKRYSYY